MTQEAERPIPRDPDCLPSCQTQTVNYTSSFFSYFLSGEGLVQASPVTTLHLTIQWSQVPGESEYCPAWGCWGDGTDPSSHWGDRGPVRRLCGAGMTGVTVPCQVSELIRPDPRGPGGTPGPHTLLSSCLEAEPRPGESNSEESSSNSSPSWDQTGWQPALSTGVDFVL